MKTITLSIILIALLTSFTSKTESDEDMVMQTMLDYVENWKVKTDKKYNNNDFLKEITMTEQSYKLFGDSIIKGIHGGLYIEDSLLIVEDSKFDYVVLKKKLEKTHKKRLKNQKWKKNSEEGKISFSYPIISIDRTIAIVYLNSYTNPLAASVELFLLKKKDGNWIVQDRFLKSIS
jgi:hypothetical protein